MINGRWSQSLINQGNILTEYQEPIDMYDKREVVAIPYKSGKYSYIMLMMTVLKAVVTALSQSLINQGNILTGRLYIT